jgi:hypothetical protein
MVAAGCAFVFLRMRIRGREAGGYLRAAVFWRRVLRLPLRIW